MATKSADNVNTTVYIVFISLLLDLLAFTMILPLFPALLEYYSANDDIGLYTWLSTQVAYFQRLVGAPEKFNGVLFGGCLGSMFSFLQFIASPIVGSISDVVGRKPVMICSLVGIAASYVLWALSNNFAIFILARFIGGISKGNVSLSMAIIADISNKNNRGKGMALVGIAFSIGFIIGPLIGSMFAVWAKTKTGDWYVVPAAFATLLAFCDLAFFAAFFKETLPEEARGASVRDSLRHARSFIDVRNLFRFAPVAGEINRIDLKRLQRLGLVYFVYLFIYSGLEFTLTFLTHHVFGYSSMQQGWMFFAIGLTMALVQGGYVRTIKPQRIHANAVYGLWMIAPSFVCVGLANGPFLLFLGLFLFALSTALVVPCMMTMASEYGSVKQKGTVMGIFRSLGALARALGPTVASVAFWGLGSTYTYMMGAIFLLWPILTLQNSM